MEQLIAASPLIALIISLIALLVNAHASNRRAREAAVVAQKQMDNALAIARRQIVSTIRQSWIDSLRGHVAELIASAQAQWIYPKDTETNPLFPRLRSDLMALQGPPAETKFLAAPLPVGAGERQR